MVYGFFTWRVDGAFDGWWYTEPQMCEDNRADAAKHPMVRFLTSCLEIRGERTHGADERIEALERRHA